MFASKIYRSTGLPTYEYKCTKCSHRFEIFQSMKDDPLTICPVCKGEIKRLIGAGSGPIFKGSGFYQTDYKNTPKKSDNKTSEPALKAATEKVKLKNDPGKN